MRKLRYRKVKCFIQSLTAINKWYLSSIIHILHHFPPAYLSSAKLLYSPVVSLLVTNYANISLKNGPTMVPTMDQAQGL